MLKLLFEAYAHVNVLANWTFCNMYVHKKVSTHAHTTDYKHLHPQQNTAGPSEDGWDHQQYFFKQNARRKVVHIIIICDLAHKKPQEYWPILRKWLLTELSDKYENSGLKCRKQLAFFDFIFI